MQVKGEIKTNGTSVDANKMSILSCYIHQDDLFLGTLTVKEHLEFHVIWLLSTFLAFSVAFQT